MKRKIANEKSFENTVEEWTQVLQYHVAALVDNELPGVNASAHRSGRSLKTLSSDLKVKKVEFEEILWESVLIFQQEVLLHQIQILK